jgi:hypothetical protein
VIGGGLDGMAGRIKNLLDSLMPSLRSSKNICPVRERFRPGGCNQGQRLVCGTLFSCIIASTKYLNLLFFADAAANDHVMPSR